MSSISTKVARVLLGATATLSLGVAPAAAATETCTPYGTGTYCYTIVGAQKEVTTPSGVTMLQANYRIQGTITTPMKVMETDIRVWLTSITITQMVRLNTHPRLIVALRMNKIYWAQLSPVSA